jgi:hypothetical protein
MQWSSPDTLIPDLYNPLDFNRYTYVRNNSINGTDPSGHDPCSTPTPGNSCTPVSVSSGGGQGTSGSFREWVKDRWDYWWGKGKYADPRLEYGPSQPAKFSTPDKGEGLNELSDVRNEKGLDPRQSPKDKTVATLYTDGNRYSGVSGEKLIQFKVNAISRSHAEIDVLNQLYRDRLETGVTRGDATMFVDLEPCGACSTSGGIRSGVEATGLDSLKIYYPQGEMVIYPRK